jgi:hypothetical protein
MGRHPVHAAARETCLVRALAAQWENASTHGLFLPHRR